MFFVLSYPVDYQFKINLTSTVDAVFDELGRDVEVPADVRRGLINQREAHVPESATRISERVAV